MCSPAPEEKFTENGAGKYTPDIVQREESPLSGCLQISAYPMVPGIVSVEPAGVFRSAETIVSTQGQVVLPERWS